MATQTQHPASSPHPGDQCDFNEETGIQPQRLQFHKQSLERRLEHFLHMERQRAGLGQGCLCVLGDSWPFPTAEAVFRQSVDDKNVSGNWVVGSGAATN